MGPKQRVEILKFKEMNVSACFGNMNFIIIDNKWIGIYLLRWDAVIIIITIKNSPVGQTTKCNISQQDTKHQNRLLNIGKVRSIAH